VATDVELEAGERVVFQSKRGGKAGYSPLLWILFIFGGLQVFGAFVTFPLILLTAEESIPISSWAMPFLTAVAFLAFLVLWIRFTRSPAYLVTDRKIIARRFLRSPLVLSPRDVGGAARFLVQYTRYGRVVNEILTNRIVLGLRSGGTPKIGPVEDAEELVALLQGVANGAVDLAALPDVNGGPARAEERTDLFFARATVTAGAPRGPVFVGPTKIIGFAERMLLNREHQMLSVAGAEKPAQEIEDRMLDLARSAEWGRGKSVVMDREGVSLGVEGNRLVIGAGPTSVAFELPPKDAERATRFVKASQAHPYRA
jgi:hypothetical protein